MYYTCSRNGVGVFMRIDNKADSTAFGYKLKYYSNKDVNHAANILATSLELRTLYKSPEELAQKAVGLKNYQLLKLKKPELAKAFNSAKLRFERETERLGLTGDVYVTGLEFVNSSIGKLSMLTVDVSSNNAKTVKGIPLHQYVNGKEGFAEPYEGAKSYNNVSQLYNILNKMTGKEQSTALKHFSNNIYEALMSNIHVSSSTIVKADSPAYVQAIAKQEREIDALVGKTPNEYKKALNAYRKLFNRPYFESIGEPFPAPAGKSVKYRQRYKMNERKDSNKNHFPYRKTTRLLNGEEVEMLDDRPRFNLDEMLKRKSKTEDPKTLSKRKKMEKIRQLKLGESDNLNMPPYVLAIKKMEREIRQSVNRFLYKHEQTQLSYEKTLGVSREALAKEKLDLPNIFGLKKTKPVPAAETQNITVESTTVAKQPRAKKPKSPTDKPKLTRSEILAQQKAEGKAQKKAIVAAAKANKPLNPRNTQILSKKHKDRNHLSVAV